jgi:hypothetical protein
LSSAPEKIFDPGGTSNCPFCEFVNWILNSPVRMISEVEEVWNSGMVITGTFKRPVNISPISLLKPEQVERWIKEID